MLFDSMKSANNVGKRLFTILIQEEPDGGFTGKCLELRGAISYGETIEELRNNMKDTISLVIDVLEDEAKNGNYHKEVIEISK